VNDFLVVWDRTARFSQLYSSSYLDTYHKHTVKTGIVNNSTSTRFSLERETTTLPDFSRSSNPEKCHFLSRLGDDAVTFYFRKPRSVRSSRSVAKVQQQSSPAGGSVPRASMSPTSLPTWIPQEVVPIEQGGRRLEAVGRKPRVPPGAEVHRLSGPVTKRDIFHFEVIHAVIQRYMEQQPEQPSKAHRTRPENITTTPDPIRKRSPK
jgi:hypothetical protein